MGGAPTSSFDGDDPPTRENNIAGCGAGEALRGRRGEGGRRGEEVAVSGDVNSLTESPESTVVVNAVDAINLVDIVAVAVVIVRPDELLPPHPRTRDGSALLHPDLVGEGVAAVDHLVERQRSASATLGVDDGQDEDR